MTAMRTGIARAVAAGAAGTTALNAVTYLDLALRGRPAGTTPPGSVERLADRIGADIPGDGEEPRHRLAGLGPFFFVKDGRQMVDWIVDQVCSSR